MFDRETAETTYYDIDGKQKYVAFNDTKVKEWLYYKGKLMGFYDEIMDTVTIYQNQREDIKMYMAQAPTGEEIQQWYDNGIIEQITDPEGIEKAVRTSEKHMNMPEGTWNALLERTLQAPEASCFWKIIITEVNGKQT